MRNSAILFLAMITLCLDVSGEVSFAQDQAITVTADGYSYLGDNDTIKIARERALAEAERNAVEQGSSTYLESQTTVKNYQVASDEIRSRIRGIISRKNILVDEMEKDTLRYHIRLEAEVEFVDPVRLMEQPEVSLTPTQDLPTQKETSLTLPPRKPSREGKIPTANQLRTLRNQDPNRYVKLMSRIQPKINDTDAFIARLRRVEARHPEAGRRIRKMLSKTPVRGHGKRKLTKRIRFMKAERPQDYILMMEILFPEVRPQALEHRLVKMKEG